MKTITALIGYGVAAFGAFIVFGAGFGLGMSSKGGRDNEPFMLVDMPGSMVLPALIWTLPGALAFGAANRAVGGPMWAACLSGLVYFAAGFGWLYLATAIP